MNRKSFVLYTASKKIVDRLSDEQAGILFKSVFAYTTGEEPPAMDGMTDLAFVMIQDYLDKDNDAYKKRCDANRENGLRGGRPRKQKEPNKTEKTQLVFMETQKNIESDSESDSESVSDKKRTSKRFQPPTVAEIESYLAEIGSTGRVNAPAFIDYYESNGWKIGKNQMKSWKATLRGWIRRNEDKLPSGGNTNANQRSEYRDDI